MCPCDIIIPSFIKKNQEMCKSVFYSWKFTCQEKKLCLPRKRCERNLLIVIEEVKLQSPSQSPVPLQMGLLNRPFKPKLKSKALTHVVSLGPSILAFSAPIGFLKVLLGLCNLFIDLDCQFNIFKLIIHLLY